MKTPIQELIEVYQQMREDGDNDMRTVILYAREMLEKEKKDRKAVFSVAYRMMPTEYDSAHIDNEFNKFNETKTL